jgi:hypothetical protein
MGLSAGRDITASNTISIGTQATASADGAIAMGQDSSASGVNAIAIGVGATATGSIAVGAAASASNGGAAFGDGSAASGTNAAALGPNATASHANASAIGNGAATSRDNQQSFGTASNTYTMAGVTSNASRQAQGKPSHIVTSNSGGDLAAYTPQELGLATTSQVSNLQSQINGLGARDRELAEGIATTAALAQPILDPGQRFGMTAAWGGYDDANAVGFSAAGILARDLLRPGGGTLALFGGVGVGANEGQVAGRAGLSFGW